jgi:hypothetical protein
MYGSTAVQGQVEPQNISPGQLDEVHFQGRHHIQIAPANVILIGKGESLTTWADGVILSIYPPKDCGKAA